MTAPELALEFITTTISMMQKVEHPERECVNTALVYYIGMCKFMDVDLQAAIKMVIEEYQNVNLNISEEAQEEH